MPLFSVFKIHVQCICGSGSWFKNIGLRPNTIIVNYFFLFQTFSSFLLEIEEVKQNHTQSNLHELSHSKGF